jgi:hypothetical protein
MSDISLAREFRTRGYFSWAAKSTAKNATAAPLGATLPPCAGQCYARRVETREEAEEERARAGLCADCIHARRIESDRGAIFYLCELAAVDPAYRKYPALPVLRCAGYRQKA